MRRKIGKFGGYAGWFLYTEKNISLNFMSSS